MRVPSVLYAPSVPEGDTINRTAVALRTALAGRPTEQFLADRHIGPHPSPGNVVEEVRSRGKHLEIQWEDGLILHTHMRMSGSWHLYHAGERWRKPQRNAVVVLEVPDWVAVCFSAPVVETYQSLDRRRHPGFGGLGPDLCDPRSDLRECVRAILRYPEPERPVADVLLDQRVLCGVGNVYRCEVLWACQLSPFARVGDLSREDAADVVRSAARMLRDNLNGYERVTAPEVPGGLAVYGRNGKRCPRCRGTIEVRRFGEHARLLYFCPECQHRLDRRVSRAVSVDDGERPADPHPAAVLFLAEARAARGRRQGEIAFG